MIDAIKKRGSGRTGPRSDAGKTKASLNAIKSGIFARTDRILPGESLQEFEVLVEGVFSDLAPVGTLETAEAWNIVTFLNRRMRAARFEAAATEFALKQNRAERRRLLRPAETIPVVPSKNTVLGLSCLPKLESSAKLHGVETHISRQLDRSLRRLEMLQRRRLELENPKTNFDTGG